MAACIQNRLSANGEEIRAQSRLKFPFPADYDDTKGNGRGEVHVFRYPRKGLGKRGSAPVMLFKIVETHCRNRDHGVNPSQLGAGHYKRKASANGLTSCESHGQAVPSPYRLLPLIR